MENREELLIRFLKKSHFVYYLYEGENAESTIKLINKLLAKYKIGRVGEWLVYTEREYACTFNYVTEEEYEKIMGNDDIYILSYEILDFNEKNYDKHKDLDFFESYFPDPDSTFFEISECFCPSIEDIEILLSDYKIIEFGNIDNNPIEWIVLEEDRNKMLLLSKYLIKKDYLTNNEFNNGVKKSKTCDYLNNDFYQTVFNDKEKKRIIEKDKCKVRIPYIKEIINFNTEYLSLKKPCRYDFGIVGVYEGTILPYLINNNDMFVVVEYNGGFGVYVFDDEDMVEYGIRAVIEIKKR